MYIKVRFTGHERSKPFWVEEGILLKTYREVRTFIKENIDKDVERELYIRGRLYTSQIFVMQRKWYDLDGWKVESKWIRKKYRTMPRYFHTKRVSAYNHKGSEWAKKKIFRVPGIKVVQHDYDLTDKSGINLISQDELYKRILENVYGTFFENSINYAYHEQNLKINLHANLPDGPMMYMHAKHFLRIVDMYNKDAIHHSEVYRKMSRMMMNSTFGWLANAIAPTYNFISDYMEFKKAKYKFQFIDEFGDIQEEYAAELTLSSKVTLTDLIKQCLEESSLSKEHLTIDITFTPANN